MFNLISSLFFWQLEFFPPHFVKRVNFVKESILKGVNFVKGVNFKRSQFIKVPIINVPIGGFIRKNWT